MIAKVLPLTISSLYSQFKTVNCRGTVTRSRVSDVSTSVLHLGGVKNSVNHLSVTCASAKYSINCLNDVLARRFGVSLEEGCSSEHGRGSTESALQRAVFNELGLNRRELSVFGNAFDCGYVVAIGFNCKNEARFHRILIKENGTKTTISAFTCPLRASQTKLMSQDPEECLVRFGLDSPQGAVHNQLNSMLGRFSSPPTVCSPTYVLRS
jgi:hypothetical protein